MKQKKSVYIFDIFEEYYAFADCVDEYCLLNELYVFYNSILQMLKFMKTVPAQ